MPLLTDLTQVRMPADCLQSRILIQKLQRIILRIVSILIIPRMLLASVLFRTRFERWNLVEAFVSVFTHVLFFGLLSVVLSEESRLRHLQFYALASLVVILLVELKADEVALLTDGCNSGGAIYNSVHKLV